MPRTHDLLRHFFHTLVTATKKNWRGTRIRILHWDMTFSKNFPRVSNGFNIWCGKWSALRITSQQSLNSEKKTSYNICTRFWHWVGSNSGPQRVSTFNLWCQLFHCTYEVLNNHELILMKNLKPKNLDLNHLKKQVKVYKSNNKIWYFIIVIASIIKQLGNDQIENKNYKIKKKLKNYLGSNYIWGEILYYFLYQET